MQAGLWAWYGMSQTNTQQIVTRREERYASEVTTILRWGRCDPAGGEGNTSTYKTQTAHETASTGANARSGKNTTGGRTA